MSQKLQEGGAEQRVHRLATSSSPIRIKRPSRSSSAEPTPAKTPGNSNKIGKINQTLIVILQVTLMNTSVKLNKSSGPDKCKQFLQLNQRNAPSKWRKYVFCILI